MGFDHQDSGDNELSPVQIGPSVVALLNRAVNLARSEDTPTVTFGHVLRGALFRPVTPAMEEHILNAAAVADEFESSAISDVHLVLAILRDQATMATQIVSHFCDRAKLISALELHVAKFDVVEDSIDAIGKP